jgi:radical SAM-linked protein
MQRIRIKYTKEDPVKFISHLDLCRVFERAIRRADIPIAFSQGYNPRMRIDFGVPIKLGLTSDNLYIDLYLQDWRNPDSVKDQINSVLPEGIKILEAKAVDPKGPSLQSLNSPKNVL